MAEDLPIQHDGVGNWMEDRLGLRDITVGAKLISDGVPVDRDDDRSAGAIQVLWIKFGDTYLTGANSCIISAHHSADKSFHKVIVEFCVGHYAVVNAYGDQAPPEFRREQSRTG